MSIDRRPIFWDNMAAQHMPHPEPYEPYAMWPGNPHGYNPEYLVSPETYIWNRLSRGQRTMFRMEFPTNKTVKGQVWGWGVPSTFWHGINRERREMLINAILLRQREDGDFTWGPYIGGAMSSPYTLSMVTADHVCDLDDPKDRADFETSMLPWLNAGVLHEIGFDAISRPQLYGAGLKLAGQLQERYGVRAIFEAYPHNLPRGGQWPDDIVWGMPLPGIAYWALSQFIEPRDPTRSLTFDPASSEIHVANHPNAALDMTAANDYRQRGFIVGSARPHLDGVADP